MLSSHNTADTWLLWIYFDRKIGKFSSISNINFLIFASGTIQKRHFRPLIKVLRNPQNSRIARLFPDTVANETKKWKWLPLQLKVNSSLSNFGKSTSILLTTLAKPPGLCLTVQALKLLHECGKVLINTSLLHYQQKYIPVTLYILFALPKGLHSSESSIKNAILGP